MITTKEITLTPQTLFKRNFKFQYKRLLGLLVAVLLIQTGLLITDNQHFWYFFLAAIGIDILTLGLVLLKKYHQLFQKKFKILFQSYYFEIDEKGLNKIRSDGTSTSCLWDAIPEVKKKKNYFELILTQRVGFTVNMLREIIRFDDFKSQEDIDTFEKLLKQKKLL